MNNTIQPIVSICCITYNQEQYIAQTIESFLMQKTDFPIEIVINDDASTDKTAIIIREYEIKYPHIIKPYYQSENQFSKGVRGIQSKFNFPRANGKYIALCEGDDYWTDPHKLQKQVEIMENNEKLSFCFHNALVHDLRANLKYPFIKKSSKDIYNIKDLLLKDWFIPTASILLRRDFFPFTLPNWFSKVFNGDYAMELMLSTKGDFAYIDEIMSVYRLYAPSSLNANQPHPYYWLEKKLELFEDFKNFSANIPFFHYHLSIIKLKCLLFWATKIKRPEKYLHHEADFNKTGNDDLGSNPLVTILICNYNYANYLGEAIESALVHTWKNLEIIVVDDGSTDESREVLKKYEEKIRVILKENGGQASAFNVGIDQAKGDLICFLDSDDLCHPDRVSRIIEKYRQAPWGLVCHDLDLIDDKSNSLKIPWSYHAGVILREGQSIDVIVENNYGWIFSPTSGMSIVKKLIPKIFPLSFEKWEISADEPLAFHAACLDSVGTISESLGSYRIHNKNLFATFHDDMKARRIAGVTHTTRRYFFCKQITSNLHSDLPEPKTNYRYYRLCCLIARDKPYLYILKLLNKNIKYHRMNSKNIFVMSFNIVRYFIADTLIILGRTFYKSSSHNRLKARFDKEASTIEKDQLRYILYDD